VGRGEEQKIQATLSAFDEVAREIAALAPETIVFVTPHNVTYADYFHISPGKSAKGSFARFGAPETRFEVEYDAELAGEIAALAQQNGLPAGPLGEKDAKLDHGVMVPMWFINRRWREYRAVRVSQSGMDAAAHYRLGQCIAQATAQRRVVLIASGDLSHKLPGSSYGTVPEGAVFDQAIAEALAHGDFLSLFNIPEELRERAAECGYNSYMVLAGCFDRCEVEAKLLSYECPFGVGYAVASFAPREPNDSRDFLAQYTQALLADAREHRDSEDCYRALARQSLEYTIRNGRKLPLPEDLPDELLNTQAGVFVSLHKHSRLRGCIGTIAPTAGSIALEIIQNAVSAGLHDNRFEPVETGELPLLTYKVDVLSPPEAIAGPEELDVRRYGVIVTRGHRRGLLLPNLEGIETVEEQVAIARQKGGIPAVAPVQLERFEVVRHE